MPADPAPLIPANRRHFIKQSATLAGAAGLGLALNPRLQAQGSGANEKVVFGLIGCGNMGRENMRHFLRLNQPVAAVCDVDQSHADRAAVEVVEAGQATPKKFNDFRRLLEQKEINAVIIGAPDHWHALIFIAACEAGKDIYCEKPISHHLLEAKAMLAAARRFRPVVQIGTWQPSMKHFQEAIAYIRSGQFGKINLCRAWMCYHLPDIGRQTPQAPPAGLDWDSWLGPSPLRPYQPNRCHEHWRWFFETGGSLMTDWGVHMIDIVLLAMQQSDPAYVTASGGQFATNDDRNTPDTLLVTYHFPDWLLTWEHRFNNTRGLDGGREHGAEFISDHGSLIVDRAGYRFYPFPPDREGPPPATWADSTHWQNFLDCVKTRQKPASDIESMAKTTIVCHLGNIAFQSGQVVRWDSKHQDVANPHQVRHCSAYLREYRHPWKLKFYS